MLRGEVLPAKDQQQAHDSHDNSTHQGRELNGVNIHAQEWDRAVAGQGADPCAADHTKEGKQVAADGVESHMGGGVFLRKIHV